MREDKRIKELQRLALNTKRILRETNFLWFKLFIECTRYCLIAHFCISFIHIFLLANNIIIKGKCASVFPMKQGFVYNHLLRGMIETWEIQRIRNAVTHFCKNHIDFIVLWVTTCDETINTFEIFPLVISIFLFTAWIMSVVCHIYSYSDSKYNIMLYKFITCYKV